MGIFSRKQPQILEAQYAPQVMGENLPSLYNALTLRVSRKDAMSVSSVARVLQQKDWRSNCCAKMD
jgi:hypothetical protein